MSRKNFIQLGKKVPSLGNLAQPTHVTETSHILGLASYYRKFNANYSNIVRPLSEWTRGSTPFHWNSLC